MTTVTPNTSISLHVTAMGSSPSQLLMSTPCHGSSTIGIRASLRARSLSNGTKPLSTKSAPQLREASPSREGSEPHEEPQETGSGRTNLMTLPEEIQENILEYLVGNLCPVSWSTGKGNATRNWGSAMRHPRAKELTNLALVTPAWRHMIQERLYRHSTQDWPQND